MIGDYLRAAAGRRSGGGNARDVALGSITTVVLGGFAALFAGFGIRTIIRHQTRLEVTGSALRATGLRRASIIWEELDRMNLAYYSTRRDRREGWMQLDLRSGHSRIRLDSRITGFAEAGRDFGQSAAEARGLDLERGHHGQFGRSQVRSGVERRLPGKPWEIPLDRPARCPAIFTFVSRRRAALSAPSPASAFAIRPRSTVALVGESRAPENRSSARRSSAFCRAARRLRRGEVLFADPRLDGAVVDLTKLPTDGVEMRAIRGGRISIIFQEPMTSLSPVHTIGNQISEVVAAPPRR